MSVTQMPIMSFDCDTYLFSINEVQMQLPGEYVSASRETGIP